MKRNEYTELSKGAARQINRSELNKQETGSTYCRTRNCGNADVQHDVTVTETELFNLL